MQHQALKYAPSLINDGQFTQGLSHWFGSYIRHVKDEENNLYTAECAANLAGTYQLGMPYGISQYLDAPDVHSYPAARTASVVRMLPLGSNLAMLVTTGDTLLEGSPLVEGVEGKRSPEDRFQHPFRWQDAEGSVNIEPTSSLSIRGYASYEGEYVAGSLLVVAATDVREIVHHRLYVSPTRPLVADASNETYGGVRVECSPNQDPTQGSLIFRGTDQDQLTRLRTTVNELGVSQIVAALNDDQQVMLTATVGGVTAPSPGQYRLEVQYAAISPGGSAPDTAGIYLTWSLFRVADVECKYAMPLFGYKYTLGYSYRGRRPRAAEVTFRQAVGGPDGFTLSGFGDVSFAAYSDTVSRGSFGAYGNYLRNIEVLRAESRKKVSGRPMLTIPVLNESTPKALARPLTKVQRLLSPAEAYFEMPNELTDTEAVLLRTFKWEEGSTGGQPAKLLMAGIVQPGNLPPGVSSGSSLGPVAFTGHLPGIDTSAGYVENVVDLMALLLYGIENEVTAELFYNGNTSGFELYAQFYLDGTPLYQSTDISPDATPTNQQQYTLDPQDRGDTLGIRGGHFGTTTDLEIPRIKPGVRVVFSNAPVELAFLNSNSYPVKKVYVTPFVNGNPGIISVTLEEVSLIDLPTQTSHIIGSQVGTLMGLNDETEGESITRITDVSLWVGDRTSELPLNGGASRDLLERHTDPLDSMFPRGAVVLYAGGGACPAGFKPVQATANARQPGIPGLVLGTPESTVWDRIENTTLLRFPLGSVPLLRDANGAIISLSRPVTRLVAAPSLEVDPEGNRLEAVSSLGDSVKLSQVSQTFRSAIEIGMILRVQETAAADGAPLVNEDRGFLVVGDTADDLPESYVALSAKRSFRPAGGGQGYHHQDAQDVGVTQNPNSSRYDPNSAEYHWGTGYGTVTYPNADQAPMQSYPGEEGYNRSQDQTLRTNGSLPPALREAMGGTDRENDALIPKYPTRFTQTPQFKPIAPGLSGQRERFYYDNPESENPRTDFATSPAFDNTTAPAILAMCRGFVNSTQIEMGNGGGSSRIGMPRGGTYGYLPNPAWDLNNINSIDVVKFPPQPVNVANDLLSGGGWTTGQGRIAMWEGMVFLARIYGKCPTDEWDEELGRPKEGAQLTGWFRSTGDPAVEYEGRGVLIGTMAVTTYEVNSAPQVTYEMNVNMHMYTFPLNVAYGASPVSSAAGETWPTTLRMNNNTAPTYGVFIMQLTPISLYGSPGQPQEYGPVEYLDWRTGEMNTAIGRSAGAQIPQSEFQYSRLVTDLEGEPTAEPVLAWATVGPGAATSEVKVLGNATGLATGARNIFVEPSGYLKYGTEGGVVDSGPGKHTHDLERNPNLLGPMNLAQPDSTDIRYRIALPSVHGHDQTGAARTVMPVANLFTSCIKL